MFLTPDKMEKFFYEHGVIERFKEIYPSGAELSMIVKEEKLPLSFFLHTTNLYDYISIEKNIQEDINRILKVEDSEDIMLSLNIIKSKLIKNSTYVENSNTVFNSYKVIELKQIFDSEVIKNSEKIFTSSLVNSSKEVHSCTNVYLSQNIVSSVDVMDSSSILNCEHINNSSILRNCDKMFESYFCADCSSLDHCFGCFNLSNKSFHVFNTPVSEIQFNNIIIMFNLIKQPLALIEYQSDYTATKNMNIGEYFNNYTQSFFKWLSTLQNYNPEIVYNITLQKEIFLDS